MNRRITALIFLTAALFTASAAVAGTISPNTTTAIGPGFDLFAIDDPASFRLFGPEVLVAFPPDPCRGICGTQSLDLTNPANPILTLVPPGPNDRNFSILWGMIPVGPADRFVYNLPSMPLGSMGNYIYLWSATLFGPTVPGGPPPSHLADFAGTFHFTTRSAIDPKSWVIISPGPNDKGSQSFQINFGLIAQGPGDLALGFRLTGNNRTMSFTPAPAPEPSALLLLGTGLLSIMGAARRKWLG